MSFLKLNQKGVESKESSLHTNANTTKLYLPIEIWRLIFSFDPTYRRFHFEKVLKELKFVTAFWRISYFKPDSIQQSIYNTLNVLDGGLESYHMAYDSCWITCNHHVSYGKPQYYHLHPYNLSRRFSARPLCLFDVIPNCYQLVFDKIERRKFWKQ